MLLIDNNVVGEFDINFIDGGSQSDFDFSSVDFDFSGIFNINVCNDGSGVYLDFEGSSFDFVD